MLNLPNDGRCPAIRCTFNHHMAPPYVKKKGCGCQMMADVQPYDVPSTTILHSHALVYLTNYGNRSPIVVHYTNILCQNSASFSASERLNLPNNGRCRAM